MGGSVLVIGVGGLGGAAVGAFGRDLTRLKKRIKTEYSENSREAPRIFTVVLDTDRSDLERVSPYTDVVSPICFKETEDLFTPSRL